MHLFVIFSVLLKRVFLFIITTFYLALLLLCQVMFDPIELKTAMVL